MSAKIVNFPIIPRATAIAPEDESDPHTKAVRMFKEARQYALKHCGATWTIRLIRALLEIEDRFNWRERAAVWKKDQK
jgi:hypothetical protein